MRIRNGCRLVFTSAITLQVILVSLFLLFPQWFVQVDLTSPDSSPSNTFYDDQGRILYQQNEQSGALRIVTPIEQIPLDLRNAVIATEDATFYNNPGFDVMAMLRAARNNLLAGRITGGASTISQQVVRLYQPVNTRYEQTMGRKLREVAMAYTLNRTHSKAEILGLYLNNTFFGHQAYGVTAAAQVYFHKPIEQLDLAECALLAGLPQAPALYDPLIDLQAAKSRQLQVLQLMVVHRKLTADEAQLAALEPLQLSPGPAAFEAPHFSVMVSQALSKLVDPELVNAGGLKVYTTLNLDLQHTAEVELNRQVMELNEPNSGEPGHNVHNGAVLALEPATGAVRALVGSPDYFAVSDSGSYNGVLALRQPGSALKPFTYAAAFSLGLTPASMLSDVPTSFLTAEGQAYAPQNYDRTFHGPVLLRQALACSYNVVAVKVLDQVGIGAFTALARQLGITSLDDASRYGLALTLGGVEVSLIQLTAAYGAFANGGYRVTPYIIERVEARDGSILYQAPVPARERVLDPRIAFLVNDILSDSSARAPAFGTNSALEMPFSAAVKTGTTTEWRDNWTVGYTIQMVVGVWIGNADNQPMVNVSGVTGAAPVWNAVMRAAHQTPPPTFTPPNGLVQVYVCSLSGQLPNEACPHVRSEWFLEENQPLTECTLHRWMDSDGLVYTDRAAASDAPNVHSVVIWPSDLVDWAANHGLTVEQGSASALANPQLPGPALKVTSPAMGAVFQLNPKLPIPSQRLEIRVEAQRTYRKTRLYVDDALYYTWERPPYRIYWPLLSGVHLLYSEGEMENGSIERSNVVTFSVVSGPSGGRE
ncbi:MAG: penicillin-binding protein 1C [Anaerolineae bacterium]